MKSRVLRDQRLRQKFLKEEQRYRSLRGLFFNSFLDSGLREQARVKLAEVGGVRTKIKNRCVITGRGRGVLREFKVSRLTFKELASSGVLVGIKKSSW